MGKGVDEGWGFDEGCSGRGRWSVGRGRIGRGEGGELRGGLYNLFCVLYVKIKS